MSTFNEADHPRGQGGQWTEKQRAEVDPGFGSTFDIADLIYDPPKPGGDPGLVAAFGDASDPAEKAKVLAGVAESLEVDEYGYGFSQLPDRVYLTKEVDPYGDSYVSVMLPSGTSMEVHWPPPFTYADSDDTAYAHDEAEAVAVFEQRVGAILADPFERHAVATTKSQAGDAVIAAALDGSVATVEMRDGTVVSKAVYTVGAGGRPLRGAFSLRDAKNPDAPTYTLHFDETADGINGATRDQALSDLRGFAEGMWTMKHSDEEKSR